ncbi:NADPH-dependent FMN reductase [Sphingomonas bisphenolicum]|uniref:NADPH-dependent oxidoreductase n=1 Tax=Sphingomonas bisphenolicum TaxID=296544 RepID=A0ABM7GAC7_9SPHN|nr:NADPH-dependent FMN reductase [Sphingomonas bisphenolicum]BBF72041.1 NADPH-dependent oxidoreductase [Sphingomonas bisphenolicum]
MSGSSSPRAKRIVGLGGTFRQASSSERLVRAVLAECEAMGAQTIMFDGPALARLPHYSPEQPGRSDEETALVDAVRNADGIVIGSPGYHGGYSGLVKNAVDLLEDLRSDDRVYFDGCPVGLVVTAAGWQACGTTLSALRDVIHAMRGWPTPVGVAVNSVEQRPFGPDGTLSDEGIARAVRAQAQQIMYFSMEPAS